LAASDLVEADSLDPGVVAAAHAALAFNIVQAEQALWAVAQVGPQPSPTCLGEGVVESL
jgi:hypothetical protein